MYTLFSKMNLLPELFVDMIYFLSVDDLIQFRLVAKDPCEYVKEYVGIEAYRIYPTHLHGLFQCFPRIKHLNLEKCETRVNDFKKFGNLESLVTSVRPLGTSDVFESCPRLKWLRLIRGPFELNLDLELDLVFQGLTHLKYLSIVNVYGITDHALLYLPQLEELNLSDRCGIGSNGLRTLTRLKKLTIDTPLNSNASQIRDEAFEGCGLLQLALFNNTTITDQGILHLKQLKRLFCVRCPLIQGVGFSSLNQLKNVGMGEATVDVSRFSNIKVLSFRDSTIQGTFDGEWNHLEKLRFYSSTFDFPASIPTMKAPRLKQFRYEKCGQINKETIQKVFGNRIQCLD